MIKTFSQLRWWHHLAVTLRRWPCLLHSYTSVERRRKRTLHIVRKKYGMKAPVSWSIWFAPSLVWAGEMTSNMDWSGCIVRLNMLTSDLTSGFSALFSHWLQVRKVGTVYLKRYYPHMKATARFKRELTTVFPALLLQGCHRLQLTRTGKKIPDREILISNRD